GNETRIRYPGLAQDAADVVADLVELFLLDVVGVDLQQQIGAALQIEAEHQMPLRPEWPGLYLGLREEVWNGAKAHDQGGQNDRQRLPPCEIQHRVDPSDPGKYAVRGAKKLSSRTSRPWRAPSSPLPGRAWRGCPQSTYASW